MIRILVVLGLSLGFVFQLPAQIKLLSARLVSVKDTTAVVGAHVVNMQTLNATYSYSDGSFLMPFTQGDTIRISSIGFEDKYILTEKLLIPDAVQITIMLRAKTYEIPGVDVSMYSSKEEFEEDFKNQEVTSKDEVFKYDGPRDLEDVGTDLNAHVSLGSPISFLYGKFSKEAKEQKRLKKAKKQNAREETIRARYNVDVVKKVTGITTDEAAKEFMKNCPLDDDYVFHASDYDIVRSILECQENNKEKSKP
jgi:hypothetical protein